MESFIWTFLYTALTTKCKETTAGDHKAFDKFLKPKEQDFSTDAGIKYDLLTPFRLAATRVNSSVLKPYGKFIQAMAISVVRYDEETRLEEFEGHDEQKERRVIKEYIEIFRELVNTLSTEQAAR